MNPFQGLITGEPVSAESNQSAVGKPEARSVPQQIDHSVWGPDTDTDSDWLEEIRQAFSNPQVRLPRRVTKLPRRLSRQVWQLGPALGPQLARF
jgi:hypothetical protein